jgi:geranylgeranyl pyrophosphate synthase
MSESMSLPSMEWSLRYFDAINSELDSVTSKDSSGTGELVRESLIGGRRTRALLTMLWCEALSGDFRAAVPVAAAYEMAHAAALIEDDLIDGSKSKKGTATFPVKYGTPRAVLVSNALLFYAPSFLAKASRSGLESGCLSDLLDLLGRCGRLTAEGEFLDLEMSHMAEVPESLYYHMISMKTGALVGSSSASGSIIGSRSSEKTLVDTAYSFGEALGMAYQIGDDLQDYFGEEASSGKAIFWDLKTGKKSLPLIQLLGSVTEDERKLVTTIVGNPESLAFTEANNVRSLMIKYDSQGYCNRAARGLLKKAESCLSTLDSSEAKDRLVQIIQYLSMSS